jgi:dipeptidyl aminopeptidase/acylaminoacyl peptidase
MNIGKIAVAAIAMAGAACALNTPTNAQGVDAFTIDSPAGYSVAGEIHYPEMSGTPVPAIVLISGSGPQNRHAEMFGGQYQPHVQWYDILTDAGFAVLSFDETGIGQSGGEWVEMGLTEHRDNIAAVIRHARQDPQINADQIYALGHSEGGMIISMLSIIDPRLAGLVYVAGPGAPLLDVVDYQVDAMARSQTDDPDQLDAVRAEVRANFMAQLNSVASLRDGLTYDPLQLAREINAPALIIQGESDWQVHADQAPALWQAIKDGGQEAEIHVFSDVNHMLVFDPTHTQDYLELTDFTLDSRLTATVASWLAHQFETR